MGSLIESIIVVLFLFSLCFYGMKVQKDPSADSYLSRELTTNIRGLLALGIVLHHASGYFTEFTFITALRFVGYLIVALFFFFSGYGLQYGFENKNKYMNGFLKKRFGSILIPYWTVTTLETVLLSVFGAEYSFKTYILALLLIKLTNGTVWYIQILILLYIVYWISHVKKENMAIFWIAFLMLFCALFFNGAQDLYYRSIFAFPLGVCWYKYREKLLKCFAQTYTGSLVLCTMCFIICLFIKTFGAMISDSLVMSLGSMSSAVMICVFFGIAFYKLHIDNVILRVLGKLSFEIYLIHNWVLQLVWRYVCAEDSILLFISISLIVTIVLAKFMNQVNKTIFFRLRSGM